jgi:signal peptidase I
MVGKDADLKMTANPTSNPSGSSRTMRILSIAGSAALVCVVAVGLATVRYEMTNIHAFRVPSKSMCPTVCENERVLASMDVDPAKPPKRGDVILFSHRLGEGSSLLFKRVIGIGGDEVSSSNGTIFVNGNASPYAQARPVCGHPIDAPHGLAESPTFATVKVPPGYFFVIGDNLLNSYDSRYPEFGLVSSEELRGHPLYIYWSPGDSRFGCAIH